MDLDIDKLRQELRASLARARREVAFLRDMLGQVEAVRAPPANDPGPATQGRSRQGAGHATPDGGAPAK